MLIQIHRLKEEKSSSNMTEHDDIQDGKLMIDIHEGQEDKKLKINKITYFRRVIRFLRG